MWVLCLQPIYNDFLIKLQTNVFFKHNVTSVGYGLLNKQLETLVLKVPWQYSYSSCGMADEENW